MPDMSAIFSKFGDEVLYLEEDFANSTGVLGAQGAELDGKRKQNVQCTCSDRRRRKKDEQIVWSRMLHQEGMRKKVGVYEVLRDINPQHDELCAENSSFIYKLMPPTGYQCVKMSTGSDN
uniref:Transposase n=1 Tax=Ascaris lumbricoides TaxID=6252 RepID=A0A0M3IUJ5_ASCLU